MPVWKKMHCPREKKKEKTAHLFYHLIIRETYDRYHSSIWNFCQEQNNRESLYCKSKGPFNIIYFKKSLKHKLQIFQITDPFLIQNFSSFCLVVFELHLKNLRLLGNGIWYFKMILTKNSKVRMCPNPKLTDQIISSLVSYG